MIVRHGGRRGKCVAGGAVFTGDRGGLAGVGSIERAGGMCGEGQRRRHDQASGTEDSGPDNTPAATIHSHDRYSPVRNVTFAVARRIALASLVSYARALGNLALSYRDMMPCEIRPFFALISAF